MKPRRDCVAPRSLFQKAIELDPGFALAHCGLSGAHADVASYGDRRTHMEQTRVLVRRSAVSAWISG